MGVLHLLGVILACQIVDVCSILLAKTQRGKWIMHANRILPTRSMGQEPVITVKDPRTGANVHIVGVSHGSPASADLVQSAIHNIKPSVVVLELCDERFLAISLESRIPPKHNRTLEEFYMKKLPSVMETEANMTNVQSILSSTNSYVSFMKNQGPIVGSFVGMGLLMSGFQRIFKREVVDEFTAAMRAADSLNIPISLGDAPQSETLKSIRSVITWDIIRPKQAWESAKSFFFSAFGVPADDQEPTFYESSVHRRLGESEFAKDLHQIEWISIPKVYFRKASMAGSLLPLFLVIAVPSLLELWPSNSGSVGGEAGDLASVRPEHLTLLQQSLASTYQHVVEFLHSLNRPLSPTTEIGVSVLSNMLAFLVMFRLGKLIGADRDRILASNIQKTCQEYPDGDVVAVLGMLHCNGVAKWLLSGQDPLAALLPLEMEKERSA